MSVGEWSKIMLAWRVLARCHQPSHARLLEEIVDCIVRCVHGRSVPGADIGVVCSSINYCAHIYECFNANLKRLKLYFFFVMRVVLLVHVFDTINKKILTG